MTTTVVFVSVAWLAAVEPSLQEAPYGVGRWPAAMGNHRARVRVEDNADAVRVHLPWRRRDRNPQEKAIHVVDATDGQRITNVVRARIDRESADLVFQPRTVPGEYYVYYLPSEISGWKHLPSVRYAKWQETAAVAWLAKQHLTAEALKQEAWLKLPAASVLEFQAISQFDRFDPMEVIATRAEVETLLAAHTDRPFLLFAENREHPIRMTDDLPRHWVRQGPSDVFQARAARGEFHVFQLGVFASRERLEKLHATPDELRPAQPGAAAIEASAIRCFNLGGVDCQGRPFHKSLCVEHRKVQALWFGVDVPADARPGQYSGRIHVGDGDKRVSISLQMEVTDERFEDHGDSDPNRLSHLRWLDSTIAIDEETTAPFTPVNAEGNEVGCLGRRVRLTETGLPESIRSHFAPTVTHLVPTGRELLAAPVDLVVERNDGTVTPFSGGKMEIVKQTPGRVLWRSNSRLGDLRLDCQAQLEFDGYLDFHLTLTSTTDVSVDDVRLEVPFVRDVAKYMMGLGRKGGLRPARHEWRWDRTKRQDRLWIGDVNAGVQCHLRGETYDRPLLNIYYAHKPINLPPAWHNQGQGGVTVREEGDDRVLLRAYSGARTIQPGQPLHFDFALVLTPSKPLDTAAHWATRYCHAHMPLDQVAASGANVINIHHASSINPYFNYPFLRTSELKAYCDRAHEQALKVKVYYTVRGLSNWAAELPMLESLGGEVLRSGPGGGSSWLQEHLGGDYVPAWCVPEIREASVVVNSTSRWDNHYLEGLDWLVHNVGIDGVYIDDFSFDRTVMRRVRKILDRGRPGSLIDLHSWNHFNDRAGFANCANIYVDCLPYVDRIWFGEEFDYSESPDYWLVEISGIPFGLMGEMLQGGGNPWRGMLFGMTGRYPYMSDPRPLWRLFDQFGIQQTEMIGYWAADCPVKTDHPNVLATVYRKPGETLIALASWAPQKVDCRLAIDFEALGLAPVNSRLQAPAVENFQPEATFGPEDPIPVDPSRGWLLVVEEER